MNRPRKPLFHHHHPSPEEAPFHHHPRGSVKSGRVTGDILIITIIFTDRDCQGLRPRLIIFLFNVQSQLSFILHRNDVFSFRMSVLVRFKIGHNGRYDDSLITQLRLRALNHQLGLSPKKVNIVKVFRVVSETNLQNVMPFFLGECRLQKD